MASHINGAGKGLHDIVNRKNLRLPEFNPKTSLKQLIQLLAPIYNPCSWLQNSIFICPQRYGQAELACMGS